MVEGWKCPQCSAVMAPWKGRCENCTGQEAVKWFRIPQQPVFPRPMPNTPNGHGGLCACPQCLPFTITCTNES